MLFLKGAGPPFIIVFPQHLFFQRLEILFKFCIHIDDHSLVVPQQDGVRHALQQDLDLCAHISQVRHIMADPHRAQYGSPIHINDR